eukprot:3021669-Alexandrium_andersonii.AAC.1
MSASLVGSEMCIRDRASWRVGGRYSPPRPRPPRAARSRCQCSKGGGRVGGRGMRLGGARGRPGGPGSAPSAAGDSAAT